MIILLSEPDEKEKLAGNSTHAGTAHDNSLSNRAPRARGGQVVKCAPASRALAAESTTREIRNRLRLEREQFPNNRACPPNLDPAAGPRKPRSLPRRGSAACGLRGLRSGARPNRRTPTAQCARAFRLSPASSPFPFRRECVLIERRRRPSATGGSLLEAAAARTLRR